MKRLILMALFATVLCLPMLGQEKSGMTEDGTNPDWLFDVKVKTMAGLFHSDSNHALAAGVSHRFCNKLYLGLELGVASGQFQIDATSFHGGGIYLNYIGLPVNLNFLRYSAEHSISSLNCSYRWMLGLCPGVMFQYFPTQDYTISWTAILEDGTREERHYDKFSTYHYFTVRTGLEFRTKGHSRFNAGLELIPNRFSAGLFLGYGF